MLIKMQSWTLDMCINRYTYELYQLERLRSVILYQKKIIFKNNFSF